jgi:hypothetical protein
MGRQKLGHIYEAAKEGKKDRSVERKIFITIIQHSKQYM